MIKLYTKQEITEMLARFMAGESSLQEEEALAQYFRTHEVDDAWREYKEMFALFDEGKVEPLPSPPQRERGLKRSVFPFLWRGIGGGLIAAGIVLMIGFSWLMKEAEPAVQEPVVAQVPAPAPQPEKPAVAEEPQETAEPAKPKKHVSSLSPGRGRLGSLEEPLNVALAPQRGANPHSRRRGGERLERPEGSEDDLVPSIPPEKQALVDIYLAEEALQVAYELQAQQEELRAYAASLTGQELPETVIAF
jgi:hypothetical protein